MAMAMAMDGYIMLGHTMPDQACSTKTIDAFCEMLLGQRVESASLHSSSSHRFSSSSREWESVGPSIYTTTRLNGAVAPSPQSPHPFDESSLKAAVRLTDCRALTIDRPKRSVNAN